VHSLESFKKTKTGSESDEAATTTRRPIDEHGVDEHTEHGSGSGGGGLWSIFGTALNSAPSSLSPQSYICTLTILLFLTIFYST
jgi:hypothetical protein